MAISTKVITMRQGNKSDYQPSKMLSGELAVINDTEELHFSPKTGKSIRIATENDIKALENKIPSGDSENPGGGSFSGNASDVTFDNEGTDLKSTDVQGAITELSGQKIDHPSTGAVGQILEIESVDENGKPKTYKAVDKPQGGGEVSDEQIANAVQDYLEENPIVETDSDFAGYSGILFFDNGNIRAYNPIVNTPDNNVRVQKVSAYLQHSVKDAIPISTEGVMAHESSCTEVSKKNHVYTWVENVVGTTADVPTLDGVTVVQSRIGKDIHAFPSVGHVPTVTKDVYTIAKKGDEVTNTLTGNTFTLQGGVGYQTSIDGYVLCGYVPSYNKVAGLTLKMSLATFDDTSVTIDSKNTWTLTIDGELGEYDYSRLPSPLNGATLHPSNQVAKIGSTYYRADVVPNNGFVLFSSTDLINWTYISHVTLPKGFDDNSATEVCCGQKLSRLYVAIRQNTDNGSVYVAKLNNDFKSINSIVALPDCGSKPYFYEVKYTGYNGLLLATAPKDRYGCIVYNIPSDYSMNKIVPVFSLVGTACNYPVIHKHGTDWISICGTNGKQSDLKGVSILPALLNIQSLTKVIPESTDALFRDSEKEYLFGEWNEIPSFVENNSGGGYTLPVATSEKLGGVMPVAKTEEMTQEVGVDSNGKLFTTPSVSNDSGNSGGSWELIKQITVTEGNRSEVAELTKAYKELAFYCSGVKLSATGNLNAYADTENGYAAIQIMNINVAANGLYGGAMVEKITDTLAVTKQTDNKLIFQNPVTGKFPTNSVYFVPQTADTTFTSGSIYVYGLPE